jgi:hypothetical protein
MKEKKDDKSIIRLLIVDIYAQYLMIHLYLYGSASLGHSYRVLCFYSQRVKYGSVHE